MTKTINNATKRTNTTPNTIPIITPSVRPRAVEGSPVDTVVMVIVRVGEVVECSVLGGCDVAAEVEAGVVGGVVGGVASRVVGEVASRVVGGVASRVVGGVASRVVGGVVSTVVDGTVIGCDAVLLMSGSVVVVVEFVGCGGTVVVELLVVVELVGCGETVVVELVGGSTVVGQENSLFAKRAFKT